MSIIKSTPAQRVINGKLITTSEVSVVSESFYETNGEYAIVITGVDNCELFLNSNNTDHVVIKSMTHVLVKADALIDEEFSEVEMNKGACVEFKKIGNFWYILSSDGMKTS